MQHNYSYQSALSASERIGWKVEDLIGGEKKLDFTKSFMPESLAQVKQLSFLTEEEQKTLNQIRGHEYLAMFGLVEEFILPYVVDHARTRLSGDDYRVRALLDNPSFTQKAPPAVIDRERDRLADLEARLRQLERGG